MVASTRSTKRAREDEPAEEPESAAAEPDEPAEEPESAAAEPVAEEDICCFCLEALPPCIMPGETAMRMICCGKEYCISCDYNWEEHGPQGCPYCRAPLPCGDEEKVALIRSKAEQGKCYAIYLMGEMHKIGMFGVERNLNLAIEWLSKGDPWCTWLLGTCYQVDSHLDDAKAFSLFLEAAAANVPVANTALATCYIIGRGTKQDQAKGMQLLAKASRQGELQGMAKLAVSLYSHDMFGNAHEVDCLVVAPSMLALARAVKSVFPETPPKYLNNCLELIWEIEEKISHVCARCRIKIDHGPWCTHCHAVRYCSEKCRRLDSVAHQQSCCDRNQFLPPTRVLEGIRRCKANGEYGAGAGPA
jgi:hypothetical protein